MADARARPRLASGRASCALILSVVLGSIIAYGATFPLATFQWMGLREFGPEIVIVGAAVGLVVGAATLLEGWWSRGRLSFLGGLLTYACSVIVTVFMTILIEPRRGLSVDESEWFRVVWRDFSQTAPIILGLAVWPFGPVIIPLCFALRWLVARIAGIAPSPSVTMSA